MSQESIFALPEFALAVLVLLLMLPWGAYRALRLPGEDFSSCMSRVEFAGHRYLISDKGLWLGPWDFFCYLLAMIALSYMFFWVGAWLVVFGEWLGFRPTWKSPEVLQQFFSLWFEVLLFFVVFGYGRFYFSLRPQAVFGVRLVCRWLEVLFYSFILLHVYAYFWADYPRIGVLQLFVIGKAFVRPEPVSAGVARVLAASELELDQMIDQGKLPKGVTGPDLSPRLPPPDVLAAMKAGYRGPVLPKKMLRLPAGQFKMGCDSMENERHRAYLANLPAESETTVAMREYYRQHDPQSPNRKDFDRQEKKLEEIGCEKNEGEQHLVKIKPFEISAHEVTFEEWDACVADGGCAHWPDDQGFGRGQHPVVDISWHEADLYVDWLNRKTGQHFQMLSESQWEYAARAGKLTAYSGGDCLRSLEANFNGEPKRNSDCPRQMGREKTLPVGSLKPNAWGLYDMHGNVAEWVRDCRRDYYDEQTPSDGSANMRAYCVRHMIRGGSWRQDGQAARSAFRAQARRDVRRSDVGFRLVRDFQ